MSDQSKLGLGQIITTPQQRDAIHVAVAPVVVAHDMQPGQHAGIDTAGHATSDSEAVGIIDPFVRGSIRAGSKVWLFLYPGTITSLRHEWYHPAFGKITEHIPSESEKWLREFADRIGHDYDYLIQIMVRAIDSGGACAGDDNQADKFNDNKAALLAHASVVLGRAPKQDDVYFSCAC